MEYRRLGRTEIEVSTVALGCWAIVGDESWGPQQEQDSIEAINAALDGGINFLDTAEAYGDGYSEELLGRALSGRREDVVIASKVLPDHLSPPDLRRSCEASLRRLRTDYIDLYQIHWPSREVPFADSLREMQKLKREGKIRAIGVSNFGYRDLTELLEEGRVEVDQLPYNLLFRAVEYEVVPACVENEVGILCYCPLAQGLLTGKFASPQEVPEGRARTRHFSKDRPRSRHKEAGAEQETFEAVDAVRDICERLEVSMAQMALAWLLHQPGVTSVLAGARNVRQATENAKAGDVELSEQTLQGLAGATDKLKRELGPNADMWQTEARIR